MTDVLVILMGLLDVVAGITLLVLLFSSTFALIIGILLISKGLMSLVPEIFKLF